MCPLSSSGGASSHSYAFPGLQLWPDVPATVAVPTKWPDPGLRESSPPCDLPALGWQQLPSVDNFHVVHHPWGDAAFPTCLSHFLYSFPLFETPTAVSVFLTRT